LQNNDRIGSHIESISLKEETRTGIAFLHGIGVFGTSVWLLRAKHEGQTRTGIVLLHGGGGFGNVTYQIETTFARGEVFYDDATTFQNRRSERYSLVPLYLQVRAPCLAHR
jgi:hypothetical protein